MTTFVDNSALFSSRPATLVELLRLRAQDSPQLPSYTFLSDEEIEGAALSYGELDQRARAIGALLQGWKASGERALLLFPPGLDYITAFFGCLYAGVIAVPAPAPRLHRSQERLQAIAADAQAAFALTTSAILSRLGLKGEGARGLEGLRWLATDKLAPEMEGAWCHVAVRSDELAYLQYTSGSTAAPKGVMVSHANVLHNCAYINHGFGSDPRSVALTWLPHYHDMGLVDGIIRPLYNGHRTLLMSPVSFLQRPAKWLQAISRYGVTHSGGPNFAYDLCVRRIGADERERLDLRSWRVAYNGAEPIRNDTLERFAAAFQTCGFQRTAFYPAYGLAEATLKVTGRLHDEPPVYCKVQAAALEGNRVVEVQEPPADLDGQTRLLVGSGRPALDTEVIIAHPETLMRCAPDEVGEIWVNGPGVTQGYWGRLEETERTFHAALADTGDGPFLRTGDLGFLKDGELFVTGRLKDLIIIRGRNHYPQDIELTMERSHAGLRRGCGAAFSVEMRDDERLVLVQEFDRRCRDSEAAIESIRRSVAEAHEVEPFSILLLEPGTIPKTSSGKIRRQACREKFLLRRLDVLAEWRREPGAEDEAEHAPVWDSIGPSWSRETVEAWLRSQLAVRLAVSPDVIDVEQPIINYGLDSLLAIELAHLIETEMGISLPMARFLEGQSIADLGTRALDQLSLSGGASRASLTRSQQQPDKQPLSHGQRALWFLHEMSPESIAYNLAVAVRINSELDVAALQGSFQALIDRHASLRTIFDAHHGAAVQIVRERVQAHFHFEDASEWSEGALNERLVEESRQPFDLRRGPLLRVHLFKRAEREHALLLVAHHIVADFWSLAVLLDELGLLYPVKKSGFALPLPPLALQYTDYARWQAEMLSGPEGESLHSYWQKRLAGNLPLLNLPTDHPRPPVQTYVGATQSFKVGAELTQSLKALGRAHGATLFMALLTAFDVLLYRYTGQEDILVGSPSAGRGRAELAGLIGYFVNPLVLRADLSGDPSFVDLLERVRQSVLAAFEHQDYPFALLVEQMRPVRNPSRSPLFDVMFVLQKPQLLKDHGMAALALGEAGARLKLGELELESIDLAQRIAQFDLTLTVAEVEDGLAGSFEYNTDLFEDATIKQLLGHYENVLAVISEQPTLRLSQIPLLSAAERQQLLYDWNSQPTSLGSELCVHEMFEQQVRLRAEAVAVQSGEEQVTYEVLNRRANQLAHYLRRLGVGSEQCVAVMMERSSEMIIALLAVLKAGAAYLPLDSSYPAHRLSFMLRDSGACLLLTQQSARERVDAEAVQTICVDVEREQIAKQREENLSTQVRAENLAYIIYTSGSTGSPKGVLITHGSLVNHSLAVAHDYALRASDRVLQFASLSFDVAAEEMYPTWLSGASVVLNSAEAGASIADFIELLDAQRVSVVNLPAAYWHEWVAQLGSLEKAVPSGLRLVVVGSERVLAERLARWQRETHGRIAWRNAYGPTEATITATIYHARGIDGMGRSVESKSETGRNGTVPIGRPIRNVSVYILDYKLNPVPVGVVGELYIGGAGLARGYHHQPALTAESFIPHPFSVQAGSRLYKTGDLARYLPTGEIEFVGRMDEQVKVRGYRVELGEIEAVLRQHEDVAEVVVRAWEALTGEKRLAAYIVAGGEQEVRANELRSYLKERLPSYMLPSAFIRLEELPITPVGKVDLSALPQPEWIRIKAEADYAAPSTSAEETLAHIWSQILGLGDIGVHDNFFELGGDSILSIQIIARANEAGLRLTPKQLFQHQTIAGLAAVANLQPKPLPEQGTVTGPLPLTPIQCWFFEQDFPEPHHWNQSVLLTARRALDPKLLEQAAGHLLTHHDALRLRFLHGEQGWQQFNAASQGSAIFSQIDLSNLPEAQQQAAIQKAATELHSGLNLSKGPLVRLALFYLGEVRDCRLLFIIHHLAVDGVSWRILLEDLQSCYEQLSRAEEVRLPAKTTSFKSWAERLVDYAHSPEIERESGYWLAMSEATCSPLPLDHQKGSNTEGSARTISVALCAEDTLALLQEVPSVYHTQVNDLLLTALVQAFARWTGASSLLVEIEGHGREEIAEDIDLSRTVGWFTTCFPALLELSEGGGPGAALKSIKEQLRRVPQRGLGYGLLRYLHEGCETTKRMNASPQPPVSFNYLGQLDRLFSGLFKFAHGPNGPNRSPHACRSHLLEINGSITEGRLQLDWTYSENLHQQSTIKRLARDYLEILRSLIAHCRSAAMGGYTPSDFPLSKLDQQKLDHLLKEYGNVEDIYPLSPMQQGMLFHSLYAPASGVYVEQLSFVFRRNLNVPAFERAWQQLINRHAVLRTAIMREALDEPLQMVQSEVKLALAQLDWREMSETEQQEHLRTLLEEDREKGFNLAEPPLMRLMLIRLAEAAYQIVWTHHHLLLDGWSLSLLFKELFALYEAFSLNQDLRLKRSLPYRDYIAWLQQQDSARAERFWRERLRGFKRPTPLVLSHAPQDSEGMRGTRYQEQTTRLAANSTARLQSLARRRKLTLNTLLQGAWALLLSRYSGEEDVLFGTTVSGRPPSLAGSEEMVGLFINTLPMRVQLPPAAPLLSWLEELQSQQSEMRQYEYSSLVEVQGWSEVTRETPLFESLLVFENYPVDSAALKRATGLEVRDILSFESTNYPLALMITPGSELSLKALFDSSSFDVNAIKQVLGHYENVLAVISEQPTLRLSQIPLLSAAERQQLLYDWNPQPTSLGSELCVHEMFEQQVRLRAEAVAVQSGEEQVTYEVLNRRANQLARYLLRRGLKPGMHVAVMMERSSEMIIALLAILKAGGAYVPIDMSYPLPRVAFMLEDAGVSLLLTEEHLLKGFTTLTTRAVCPDIDRESVSLESEENLSQEFTSDFPAYVIYTSGSTGSPKGVVVPHAAINRLVLNTNYVELRPFDRVAQVSNVSFDAATFEIWGALLNGARLVCIQTDVALSPVEFARQLRAHEISTLFLTTALFNQVADDAPWAFGGLRHLLFGGEAVHPKSVQKVLTHAPPQRLLHVYGPTEATTFTTWHPVKEVVEGARTIPIGSPLENAQVYLLDRYFEPVPVGVPGELYIGGNGLAHGYHHQPALTAESFIPHPFSVQAGSRLYKTGDLARYLPTGEIEFVGRVDEQVKVRGYRVELGEIEAVLRQHEDVAEVVVRAWEALTGEKRLAAYLVCGERRSARPEQLRGFLKQRLPDYMIPSAFMVLDELPLTPNGKVDRRALPLPDRERPRIERAFVAPRSPVEEMLAEIWAQVLDLEQIGIDDDFFELGGHSLKATQVISRLRGAFNVEMPVRSLFDSPTIAGLAHSIEAARRMAQGLSASHIPLASTRGEMPLSFSQLRLWFLHQLMPESASYNIAGAVCLEGPLDARALERSFNEMVRRHEILRTTFMMADGSPRQRVACAYDLKLAELDLTGLLTDEREAEALRLAEEEARRPFNLKELPLLRATLLRLSRDRHFLIVTMHHIISDGWSIGVLIRELATLYELFLREREGAPPELQIQYADFAAWQRDELQGQALDSLLAYWKQRLSGNLSVLELPTDCQRGEVRSFKGASHSFTLPGQLSASLKSLSRREGVTLFMTLLAAFDCLLHRYTKQSDILVGTPVANRNRAELEGLIGCFVNILVLRTDLSDDPTFRQLLSRVREDALGAYAHQDLPFEKLVEELQPEQDLSRSPLFQVMFVLQNMPLPTLELSGLRLSRVNIPSATSNFDITLVMEETEQGLVGSFDYNSDLFIPATIARMAGHFQTLLEGAAANPNLRLSRLPLLTAAERHEMLIEWNDTQSQTLEDLSLHQLFEAQAAQTPDAIALLCEHQQLSYNQLNRRANQLARYLKSLGLQTEARVAILVERSIQMIVALLAVMKAGAAYVPMDPSYPSHRLSLMMSDAGVQMLLTEESMVERQLEALGAQKVQTICVDVEREQIAKQREENLSTQVRAENLAYIIYTSGSTGSPKGVMVEHGGLCNLIKAQVQAFGVRPDSRVLQFASLSFDASVSEIFMALCTGATLFLETRDSLLPGPPLVERLRERAITTATLPPAVLAMLDADALPSLHVIIAAGETCSQNIVAKWAQGRRFFNAYGPTEATVCATIAECLDGSRNPPIGQPIANTQVYLLDQQLEPVPVGIVGELYIGGAGLARGYHHQPALTAESFIPHPFSVQAGSRLYKTGDLARYLPTGEIEFVGRVDEQVKVRGYRVELGEIEAVLRQHEDVRESVILTRRYSGGEGRLVAYLVLAPGSSTKAGELRGYLKERLPGYMMPSAFVLLDELPLTANGKIDKASLPDAQELRSRFEPDYVVPATEVERTIAAIWQEALHVERVGAHDNFFELGGHSLLMADVQTRLREVFEKDLSLLDMFRFPTVRSLATYLTREQQARSASEKSDEWAGVRRASIKGLKQLRRERRGR